MRWAIRTSAALGLWLIVAPFALGYTSVSMPLVEDVLGGILIASVALSRAVGGQIATGWYVEWLQALAGLWVFLAPLALGYTAVKVATLNDTFVGLAVLLMGVASAVAAAHGAMPLTTAHPLDAARDHQYGSRGGSITPRAGFSDGRR